MTYQAKIESATKESIPLFPIGNISVVSKVANDAYQIILLLRKYNYNNNITCVRIYKDDILIEQYGTI